MYSTMAIEQLSRFSKRAFFFSFSNRTRPTDRLTTVVIRRRSREIIWRTIRQYVAPRRRGGLVWCVRIKGPIVRDVRPVRSENRQFRTRTITTAAVRGKPIQARTLLLGRLSVVRLVPSYSNLIFIYILLLIRDFVAHNRNGIVEERIAVERRVRVLRPVNASETTLRYSASGRCENGQALTNRRANWLYV